MEKEPLSEKLREHLRLEESEVTFYAEGLNKADNVVVGLLYQSFVEDSKRHITIIKAIMAYLQTKKSIEKPFVAKLERFPHYEVQEEAHSFVKDEIEMTEDPFMKLLLMSIAYDEEKHAKLMKELMRLLPEPSAEK